MLPMSHKIIPYKNTSSKKNNLQTATFDSLNWMGKASSAQIREDAVHPCFPATFTSSIQHASVTNFELKTEYKKVNYDMLVQFRTDPSGIAVESVGLAVTRLLEVWVLNPPGVWMAASCECRVLSRTVHCDRLLTHPEEPYPPLCAIIQSYDRRYISFYFLDSKVREILWA